MPTKMQTPEDAYGLTSRGALKELRMEFKQMRDYGWGQGKFKRKDGKHNDPAMGRNAEWYLDMLEIMEKDLTK